MSSFENIRSLSSFRHPRDEVIPRDVVGKILEAGRNTPSPGNVQSLEFIAVEDDHSLENLGQMLGDHRVAEAPISVIVLADEERMNRKLGSNVREFCFSEGATAVQNMRLVAEEEGLSSIWKSGFDEHSVAQNFKVPDGKIPVSVVSFAFTDNPVENEPPFGMNEVVYYDEYGHQIGSFFDGMEWRGLDEETRIFQKRAEGFFTRLKRRVDKVL
ncbi:nitroreductase family protein [Candidatus Nanohalobium constans]|uniref:Nitroreductase n=1 Tax=Candidatus Nanohalobium constans TaxID=2565781 RepID=A0A5Q0UIG4_9ARCH|nr:nitroreductase family protein [Candidatus Nanohalobium constans]QGA80735.1 nitroreductase [Candidatus Nanohalobium constans]